MPSPTNTTLQESNAALHEFGVEPDEPVEASNATFADLRARCPVAHTTALGGFWAVAKYADVVKVAADPQRFTTTEQNVIPKIAFTGRRPPLHLDPPEHTIYRSAINPLLSPGKVAALAPEVRRIVLDCLVPLLERGEADISLDFGSVFPVRVFAAWMQLPADLQARLMEAGPAFVRAVEAADNEAMRDSSLVLYEMARDLIALRKAQRLDALEDPVSALLAVRKNGEALPDEMIVGAVRQILVVGIVAPMVMTGAIALHLAAHPDLHQKLRNDTTLVPAATEEFLRLLSPYRGFARTAREDVQIGGRCIAAGEPIAVLYTSANRDADVFECPEEFRLDRPNINDHLAFGKGPHFCAGASLGRLEMQMVVEHLVTQTTRIEIIGPVLSSPFPEIGPRSVPVRFHR